MLLGVSEIAFSEDIQVCNYAELDVTCGLFYEVKTSKSRIYMYKIADAHCDLLGHLEFKQAQNATPHDPEARCSLPQLRAGNVGLQVTAIFTVTKSGSSKHGIGQSEWFKKILMEEPNFVSQFPDNKPFNKDFFEKNKTFLVAAIENASGFWAEDETFEQGIKNLTQITENVGQLFYISLTHHLENRFGGGNQTTVGLKKDGKRFLEYLSDKKIALDFAHASDPLIIDALNFMDKNNLEIPVIASHSNLRKLHFHPRNLPTELAQEILKRGGIIGLNWLHKYLGKKEKIAKNLQMLIEDFKAEKQVCSGADLFSTGVIASEEMFFYPEYQTAADFPKLMSDLEKFGFSEQHLRDFAHGNLIRFIQKLRSEK